MKSRGVIVLGAILASAAFAQAPAPRLFKLGGKVGARYPMSIFTEMKSVGAQGAASFQGTIDETLLSAKPNELTWQLAFKVAKTSESGVMKGAAAGFKQMDGLVMKRVTDPTGQTLKLMVGDISIPSSGTPDLVFAKRAVKVGDSWPSQINMDGQMITIDYRLEQYGKFGQTPAAKFTGRYRAGQIVRNLTLLTFWVDLKDGKTLSSAGAFRATKSGATIDVKFELKRR
ncbi:MAG TPA: hypothetical protein PLX06_05590 [Fimbriimonadaceae bacterium]|nr:hypothetical protein [Fimbriimonadaceae bacterium]